MRKLDTGKHTIYHKLSSERFSVSFKCCSFFITILLKHHMLFSLGIKYGYVLTEVGSSGFVD
jgi:hypothetical protein